MALISDLSHIVSLRLPQPLAISRWSKTVFYTFSSVAFWSRTQRDIEQLLCFERPPDLDLQAPAICQRINTVRKPDTIGIQGGTRSAVEFSRAVVIIELVGTSATPDIGSTGKSA